MKGNISLKEFIEDVKNELREASESEDPFFIMDEVELEVSFALNTKGTAGGKFIVIQLGGEVNASQVHKVKLKLTPFKEESIEPVKSESVLTNTLHQRRSRKNIYRKPQTEIVSNEKSKLIKPTLSPKSLSEKNRVPATCSLKKSYSKK